MFYITTADKLTRTSKWLEKLEGGIEYLKKVILEDYLGICDELEKQMAYLIGTYLCEWKAVVDDPERRQQFQQFSNTKDTQDGIEFISERGQKRPADWPKEGVQLPPSPVSPKMDPFDAEVPKKWICVGKTDDFGVDVGRTIKYGDVQIAVFHLPDGSWYATQNMCPHKRAMVLSQGLLGDSVSVTGGDKSQPYVSCPMHKKNFGLQDGKCLSPGDEDKYQIQTFDVKVAEGDKVFLLLPPVRELDDILATDKVMIHAKDTQDKFEWQTSMELLQPSSCATTACGSKELEW
jgi:nitrite reductase (NAD(P)H)